MERKLCSVCEKRRPLFYIRGRWKVDRAHGLCRQCWQAETDRRRECREMKNKKGV